MDICYLLLKDKLPLVTEKVAFELEVCQLSNVDESIWHFLETLPVNAHPVGNLLTAVSMCAAINKQNFSIKDKQERFLSMMHAIGHMPTLVAACIRVEKGLKPILPKPELGYIKNFLYMCFGSNVFDAKVVDAMDKIFILHADHEQNASTSTVRMAGSTGTPGFAALWGPAHGGANEACINMLKKIGSVDQAESYINKVKDKNNPFRLMGFGHRVYKNYDPRATIMRDICNQVINNCDKVDSNYLQLAKKLEETALQDEYFISRKLYPNIDFYSGLTLDAIGFSSKSFTALFALGRTIGWASHWLEMFVDQDFKISRPRQWYIGLKERNV